MSLAEHLHERHATDDNSTSLEKASPSEAGNGACIDAAALPRLPGTFELPTLPKGERPSWMNAAKSLNSTKSAQTTCTGRLMLPNVPTDAGSTVANIQKLFGVSIEASKPAGGVSATTFLIRGPQLAVERATDELRVRLGPRIKTAINIPAAARSTVIGTRGAALKSVEEKTRTVIELAQPRKLNRDWDLEVIDVSVSGHEAGVNSAVKHILEHANERGPFSASRTLTPEVAQYITNSATCNAKVAAFKDRITIRGKWEELHSAISAVDFEVDKVLSTFVSKQVPEAKLLADLPEDVVLLGSDTLWGSPEAVAAAAKLALDFAGTQERVQLDISKSHGCNVEHAALLSRFLEATSELTEIERSLSVRIFRNDDLVLDILGTPAATKIAKRTLIARINSLGPDAVVSVCGNMDKPIVRESAMSAVRAFNQANPESIKAVLGSRDLFLAWDTDEDEFGGTPPAGSLANAASLYFSELPLLANGLVERSVTLPSADMKHVRDPLGPEARSLAKKILAPGKVHVDWTANEALLSGSRSDVGKASSSLAEIIKLSKEYAQRASFTDQLTFDPQLVPKLIGRSGAQIGRIRELYPGVRIDIEEAGHVSLRGVESEVAAAKKHLQETLKRLRDETTTVLHIPSQYHSLLIGSKGKNVRRLSEKHGCSVRFPKDTSSSGSSTSTRGSTPELSLSEPLGDDGIEIRGPSKGVNAVRKEFMDLVEYEKMQSFNKTISVPSSSLPRVIGRNGTNINTVKSSTGVQIQIPAAGERDSEIVEVTVTGEKKSVNEAINQLQAIVDTIADHVERQIDVAPRFHGLLIGPGGSTLRQIVADSGGVVEPWNPRTLMIPPASSHSTNIQVSGPSKVVEAIISCIKEIVEKESARERVVVSFNVPRDQHRALIGPGGSTKHAAEEKFGVVINIPRSKSEEITIKGPTDEAVCAAKAHLLNIASQNSPVDILIPQSVESALWAKGQLAQKWRAEGVRITPTSRPTAFLNVVPDQPPFLEVGYAWSEQKVIAEGPAKKWEAEAHSAEAAKKAKKEIEEQANDLMIAFLWLEKPAYFRQIIGTGGASINSVRAETGALVTVPRQAEAKSPVIVQGSQEQVEEAKKQLLRAIRFD